MTDVVGALRAASAGEVSAPGEPAYTAATTPENSSFPQHPAAVVKAVAAKEISSVVAIAAAHGLRVVVQATGHGAGEAVTDDEILLDTSAMNTVAVDAGTRTARVGAGVTWPAVQNAAMRHGLLGLSGTSPTVGVAGYTFGGGVGWLVRKHGVAAAALRAVDYVDGTGRVRRAEPDADDVVDREALWAFRGGGPVGVATALEIGLVPVHDLWTGYLLWPADDLDAVAAAWAGTCSAADRSVSSALSLLALPPAGPFPDDLLGRPVVHLSFASPDGADGLAPMRAAVRDAARPVIDTTAAGDTTSLAAIHLDPPAAVPARGEGRWLGPNAPDVLVQAFEAAHIGAPGGLSMIELRHTETGPSTVAGALTSPAGPFLLHAVGAAPDDQARGGIDRVLRDVEVASRPAALGRAARSFREGQPDAGDGLSASDLTRLRAVRDALDPQRVLHGHRDPTSSSS